jgi:hypothetical protein
MRTSAPRPLLFALLALTVSCGSASATVTISGAVQPKSLPNDPLITGQTQTISYPDWNVDVSGAPVDAHSHDFINFINIGGPKSMRAAFGGRDGPVIWGFPYIVVGRDQPKKSVDFLYASESDGVDHATGESLPFYPIPDQAIWEPDLIQGGPPGNVDLRDVEDRHLIIFDADDNYLYELYAIFYDSQQQRWKAEGGAFFDLNVGTRRPEGWTSADASGLPILPGIIRYEEVYGPDEIRHAIRITLASTNGHVYPASHGESPPTPGALPIGARLRLKAGTDLSTYPADVQKIFRAMRKFGLLVADNGADMDACGTWDPRWDNNILNPAFASLTAADFEVIQLGYRPQ